MEEGQKDIPGGMLLGMILGGIVGILLFLLAYILPGGSLFSGEGITRLLIFLIPSLVGGALFGILLGFPTTRKIAKIILWIVIIAILGIILFNIIKGGKTSSLLGKTFGGVGEQASKTWKKNIAPYVSCLWLSDSCVAFQTIDDPDTNKYARELLDLEVEFPEKELRKDEDLDILVRIRVRNNELGRIEIQPKCFIKDKQLTTQLEQASGNTFVFYNDPRVVQFRCRGENPGKDFLLKVVLEHPSVAVSTWDVWITKNEEKVGSRGEISAVRNATSPYMINFISSDQPFMQGEISTNLIFKRHYQEIESEIINLEFLSIISQGPSTLKIECGGFSGSDIIEINNLNREALEEYKKEGQEKYIFPCTLIIKRPKREEEHNGFLAQALYTVKREYTQKIFMVE